MTSFEHHCDEIHAPKFWTWITERGGVAIWSSIDLSDPSFSQATPALTDGQPTAKPSWKVTSTPIVITDANVIGVYQAREVKRFHVAIRQGAQGLSFKVTDGGSRRIRAAVAKAGEGAFYSFDFATQEAIISIPDGERSLAAWAAEQPSLNAQLERGVPH